ncbi:transcription initiation factor TFIID subunit 4-like, partial [Manacus candei]|uniref:transcription initiation factor TFIID subunit 4-like n=1 Tax=Manacus candei TaxID=415023 RepID=UPI0022266387
MGCTLAKEKKIPKGFPLALGGAAPSGAAGAMSPVAASGAVASGKAAAPSGAAGSVPAGAAPGVVLTAGAVASATGAAARTGIVAGVDGSVPAGADTAPGRGVEPPTAAGAVPMVMGGTGVDLRTAGGGAGAVPAAGITASADTGPSASAIVGGAGAAPSPPSPPVLCGRYPPTTGGMVTSAAPPSYVGFPTVEGGKQELEGFPASAPYHQGTSTPSKSKSVPASDRKQRQGLPPFDPSSVKVETRDSDFTDTDTETSDGKLDSSTEEKKLPVVKPKTKGRRVCEALADPSPVARRTRTKEKPVVEAPLIQAMGNQGPVLIKAPFSLVELQQWKAFVGAYRDNPDKVANYMERAIRTQNPDWCDLEVMMDTLLDSTEKQMVKRAAQSSIELLITGGVLTGKLKDIFPLEDPKWDPNLPEKKEALKRYQDWVVYGFRHGIPKAVNWSKVDEVRQDRNESPTDFLNRLKKVIRKYTDIDTESCFGENYLVYLFIYQSADDIRKKLQEVGGRKDIGKLLDIAWTVYRNRDQKGRARVPKLEEDTCHVLHRSSNCQERRKHNAYHK